MGRSILNVLTRVNDARGPIKSEKVNEKNSSEKKSNQKNMVNESQTKRIYFNKGQIAS